jgi:hypothetical protein
METPFATSVPEGARVPVWAWLVVAVAVLAVYGLTLENGALLKAAATSVHELFHDGRHFLGVPCH